MHRFDYHETAESTDDNTVACSGTGERYYGPIFSAERPMRPGPVADCPHCGRRVALVQ